MLLKITKEREVRNLVDAVRLAVKESPKSQKAIAADISAFLASYGLDVSDAASHFNEGLNDDNSPLCRALYKLDAIIRHCGNDIIGRYVHALTEEVRP